MLPGVRPFSQERPSTLSNGKNPWLLTTRQVRRLLDLDHRSRLDQLEAALAALGRHLVLEVQDAA